jgi:pyruvate kinase
MASQDRIHELQSSIDNLLAAVRKEADASLLAWRRRIDDPSFLASAENLAAYLALRHRDLRPLQRQLMTLGLSSLGRIESRVLPTLQAVSASLGAICGVAGAERASEDSFFAGEGLIDERAAAMFGPGSDRRPVALLCTCPSEAASDPGFMRMLADHRVEAIRINCAHDDQDAWHGMIEHARAAQRQTQWRMRIYMDLAGPKSEAVPSAFPRIGRGSRAASCLRSSDRGPSIEPKRANSALLRNARWTKPLGRFGPASTFTLMTASSAQLSSGPSPGGSWRAP